MYVRDLMTPRVIAIKATETLGAARQKLQENRIHHLVVMDGEKIVGIIGYRDLIGKTDTDLVMRVMSPDVATIEPWDTIRNAATRMIGRKHGCLPVTEGGHVRGVITTTDLLRAVSHTKSL